MKKKLILFVAILAILVANFAILPINAATEDVSAVNENSSVNDIYINTNYTMTETLEIFENLDLPVNEISNPDNPEEKANYSVYLILRARATIGSNEEEINILYVNISDGVNEIIQLVAIHFSNGTENDVLMWEYYDDINWEPITQTGLFIETEEPGIYKIAFSEQWELFNEEFEYNYQGFVDLKLTPYTKNEKLKSIIYDITPPPPPVIPPTIFELIYSFIYETILGGESELFDTSQLAVLLTLFLIILIIFSLISIIKGIFKWFRVRR